MLLLLLVTLAGLLQASEAPPPCASNTYTWDGTSLHCMEIDRVSILTIQRNSNMQALQACREEVKFLKARQVLEVLHQNAREKCKEQGKLFDENSVKCGDSLPSPVPGTEEQRLFPAPQG